MSNESPRTNRETLHQAPGTRAVQEQLGAVKPAGCVAGVDVGGTNLRVALADSTGTILARQTLSTVGVRSPDIVIEMICECVRNAVRTAEAPPDSLKAVAVGVPGVTDVDHGIVIATSYLMGWQNVALQSRLEEELNVPATVDNDVNLAAVGESWLGSAQRISDFVFLAIGTGVGAGIVLNGHLYRGNRWAAGEVGYLLLPGTAAEPGKDDEPGALECVLGGEGIREQWRKHWSTDISSLPGDLSATQVFDHAQKGDSLAQTILTQSATALAHTIYNLFRLLNCPLFVLGGSVGLHPSLGEATCAIIREWDLRSMPDVRLSALGVDAQLLGAIRTALDASGSHTTTAMSSTNRVAERQRQFHH